MNEVWQDILKKYLDCYEAIETLSHHNVLNCEEFMKLRGWLLDEIIVTFRSEVED